MAEAITNIFVYIGVYTFIATAWRVYEQVKYKHTNPNSRDTVICLVVSLFIVPLLYMWRVM